MADGLKAAGLDSMVIEVGARDSATFFSIVFDSPTSNRKAIHAAESSAFHLDIGGSDCKAVLRAD